MIEVTRNRAGLLWHRTHGAPLLPADCGPFIAFLSPATRIENEAELRSVLGLAADTSLQELLLAAWRRWGRDLPDKLRGAFAVGIFDAATASLFLFRDVSGLAPVYYIAVSDRLVVAGTSRIARAIFGRPIDPDLKFHATFLHGVWASRDATFFAGMKRLPAAHHVTFSLEHNGEPACYWSPSTVPFAAPSNDTLGRFQEVFDNSVRRHYRKGMSALQLSGGLDSSAILGSLLASGLAAHDLPCLAMTYRETHGWSDGPYLDSLKGYAGILLKEVPSDTHGPLVDMERWLEVLDGPYVSYGHSVASNLLHVAASLGLTNLYSGHGGDEVIGYGTGRLNELAQARRWIRLWCESVGISRLSQRSRSSLMRSYLAHYQKVRWIDAWIRRVFRDPGSPSEMSLSNQAIEMLDPDEIVPPTVLSRGDHDDRMVQAEMLEHPVQQLSLETIGQCSVAAGIETVMPFYSRDLIDLAVSLPSDWKLRFGQTRYILREAMRGRLPEDVRMRQTKFDFTAPFVAGLHAQRELVLDWTADKPRLLVDLVKSERLSRARDHLDQFGTMMSPDDARFLWRCTVLAIWGQQVDPAPAPPPLEPLYEPS